MKYPGRSEEENVDADEGNGSFLSTEILGEHVPGGVLACRGGAKNGN